MSIRLYCADKEIREEDENKFGVGGEEEDDNDDDNDDVLVR